MGKDFIPLRANGASQKQIADVYSRLKQKEVVAASSESMWHKHLPDADEIAEIEIGDVKQGTRESTVTFRDGTFVAFDGVVRYDTILKAGMRGSS